ncbi:hypothetical protein AB0N05_37475 [Nocardia sp. NPDC051030]|uniref:hypothetical protein n=1 Tax=Nocardia sp. NPDC051030 TaxID=3155162 RepID=UPI0034357247
MTRNARKKTRIRARKATEGIAYSRAARHITTPPTVLVCPPWCVEHLDPDLSEPGDQGTHHGRERSIPITTDDTYSSSADVLVQLAAGDHAGVRHSIDQLEAARPRQRRADHRASM